MKYFVRSKQKCANRVFFFLYFFLFSLYYTCSVHLGREEIEKEIEIERGRDRDGERKSGASLREKLGIAGHDLHPSHVLLRALVLEGGVLKYEGPHVVAEPVRVQMSLRKNMSHTS